MRTPDLDRERCEKQLSVDDFLKAYNEDLPSTFPRASVSFLTEFRRIYPALFKDSGDWSLDRHRKKVMDWLPQRMKSNSE